MPDIPNCKLKSHTRGGYVAPIRATLLVAGLALSAGLVLAQEAYPNKEVRLVVPFAPGGATDTLGRILAERLGAVWKQSVIVDNRPGASGTLGSNSVAKSKKDGYTILLGTSSTHAVAPTLRPSLPYNAERDYVPITLVATTPFVLVVHPSIPAKSLTEFVSLAKGNPNQIPYDGTPGTAPHMAMELLSTRARVKLQPIAYKGSALALMDLAGGQLHAAFSDVPPSLPFIRDGKLRALAVTSPNRLALLPQVPTVAESGFPGYDGDAWLGLFAPAGTSPEIARKIAADLRTALNEPNARRKLEEAGFTLIASSPSEFAIRIKTDIQKWRKVITDAGIKID
jgi:tripartite-type tricarboxylate transporter receptor subunit TctC